MFRYHATRENRYKTSWEKESWTLKQPNTAVKDGEPIDEVEVYSQAPGQPVSGARGKFGEYLNFSSSPPRPKNFDERFKTAYQEGRSFADDATYMTRADVHDNGKMRLVNLGFTLRFQRHGTAWDDIYGAAFWFAASIRSSELGKLFDLPCTNAAICGARCQRNLTRALVSISEEDRKHVSLLIDSVDQNNALMWGRNFKGAMSVARVAYGLHGLGQRIILPSIHIDMIYKIDLLVEMKDSDAGFLCLQIKGTQDERSNSVMLTPEAMDGRSYNSLQLETRSCIEWFSEQYDVPCIPALVQVGRSISPWDIGNNYTLDLTLQRLMEVASE
jgi:hypothetical protein